MKRRPLHPVKYPDFGSAGISETRLLLWKYSPNAPTFHECVQGCEEVKAVIRGLDGIDAHLTEFRQKPRPPKPGRRSPTQQEAEWLMGKFSSQTVDSVCAELFGGEG